MLSNIIINTSAELLAVSPRQLLVLLKVKCKDLGGWGSFDGVGEGGRSELYSQRWAKCWDGLKKMRVGNAETEHEKGGPRT